jgi:hypothetical protein
MKKYLIIGGVALGIAVLGFAFGRYSAPVKVVEKEKIKIVEVEKKKVNEKKDVTTVVVTKPDGTTTTTTRDTSVTDSSTDTSTVATSEKSKTTTYKKPNWVVAGLIGADVSNFSLKSKPIYGGSVSRKVLGPISVGGWGMSNGTFGASISLEF